MEQLPPIILIKYLDPFGFQLLFRIQSVSLFFCKIPTMDSYESDVTMQKSIYIISILPFVSLATIDTSFNDGICLSSAFVDGFFFISLVSASTFPFDSTEAKLISSKGDTEVALRILVTTSGDFDVETLML